MRSVASCISAVTLPPFGELAAGEQRLEGRSPAQFSSSVLVFVGTSREVADTEAEKSIVSCAKHLASTGNFRGKHSELITNCEQIAFLGGERPEKDVLNVSFAELMSHCKRTISLSFNSEVLRQYLNKYFCTVIGLILIARPLRLRSPALPAFTSDQIAQYFTSTWRNMEAMATAIQDCLAETS